MAEIEFIRALIKSVVEDRLGEGTRIRSVSVSEDKDEQGDGILLVRVVYDGGRLDPKRLAGLIRHIRSKLHGKASEDRFPLLSFVSQADAEAEAA